MLAFRTKLYPGEQKDSPIFNWENMEFNLSNIIIIIFKYHMTGFHFTSVHLNHQLRQQHA